METRANPTPTGPRLDRAEVQRFEQNYEAWIQSMVRQVLPDAKLSVLTEFSYSNNPELIQNYEERRAAAHLPGLPDVSDMDDSHPTENPIFDLITQQNVKIIFDRQPTDEQSKIVKEILSVKLNLDSAHGDQLSIESLGKAPSTFSGNLRLNVTLLLLFGAAVAAVLVRRHQVNARKKEGAEKGINELYQKLDPIASIVKTDARLLIAVVRKQNTEFLVQVMAHAPVSFVQVILQVFEEDQRKEVFETFQANRLGISAKKSKYSQLLLAAKIHDEAKLEAMQQVDQLNEVTNKIAEQRNSMQQSLKQLKALYISDEANETSEVNHEASI